MHLAQKWGSFFYTYTQCTKFSFGFLFQGNSGNIREFFVFPCLHEGERRKKGLRPFRLIISHCGEGLPLRVGRTRRLRRRLLVNLRSRWSTVDMINFIIAHFNSSVARSCISLSRGIRMFARWSETRGVSLKSVIFCRARSRIPNHK